MQSIPFHIAYLLTEHECVIVPGFGAFVVSPSDREKAKRWGILSPSAKFLGFNSEIKHNDGLLANSIIKEKKCSYKEANSLIEKYVIDISHSLDEEKTICFPWVGNLYLKDNKLLFQPERTLSCNAFNYGLAGFSMSSVKDIQQQENIAPKNFSSEKKDKEVVWIPVSRKFITYTGSVAAALIAMCIIPTPLNNGHFNPAPAQFASVFRFSTQNEAGEKMDTLKTSVQMPVAVIATPLKKSDQLPETVNPPKANAIHYYIIIASLPNLDSAKKTLTEFQSKGFQNAAILSADGRHRIYTNRFEDKPEAEKFLLQFRKDYPAQANAWLLKQKD